MARVQCKNDKAQVKFVIALAHESDSDEPEPFKDIPERTQSHQLARLAHSPCTRRALGATLSPCAGSSGT